MNTHPPRIAALLFAGLLAGGAQAAPTFSELRVFGDSLSDNGNAFIGLGGTTTTTPVTGDGFIPDAPYVRGGTLLPAFSNGPVWVELFAQSLGLGPLQPSSGGGTNHAVGGARVTPTGNPLASPAIPEQVDAFLAQPGASAPSDALYVIWGGGNDARDAATLAPVDLTAALMQYGNNLAGAVGDLILGTGPDDGARTFVIVNVPDFSLAPAVQAAGAAAVAGASALVAAFNDIYDQTMDFLDEQFIAAGIDGRIIRFDVAGLVGEVAADPAAFGLGNVGNACAGSPACIADPSTHLFWDGIHPSSAGHAIIAAGALNALRIAIAPAPATLLLLAGGLVALAVTMTSRSSRRRALPMPAA